MLHILPVVTCMTEVCPVHLDSGAACQGTSPRQVQARASSPVHAARTWLSPSRRTPFPRLSPALTSRACWSSRPTRRRARGSRRSARSSCLTSRTAGSTPRCATGPRWRRIAGRTAAWPRSPPTCPRCGPASSAGRCARRPRGGRCRVRARRRRDRHHDVRGCARGGFPADVRRRVAGPARVGRRRRAVPRRRAGAAPGRGHAGRPAGGGRARGRLRTAAVAGQLLAGT